MNTITVGATSYASRSGGCDATYLKPDEPSWYPTTPQKEASIWCDGLRSASRMISHHLPQFPMLSNGVPRDPIGYHNLPNELLPELARSPSLSRWDGLNSASGMEVALLGFSDIIGAGAYRFRASDTISSATLAYHVETAGAVGNLHAMLVYWDE